MRHELDANHVEAAKRPADHEFESLGRESPPADGAIEPVEGLSASHRHVELDTGSSRVNLATAALEDPAWCARAIAAHGKRIAVALDVRVVEDPDGSVRYRLAARGSTRGGGDLWESLARLDRDGCARYVVTDVSRDGTLRGPNVELYRAVTRATTAPVIASGGIATIGDLVVLADVAASGANLEGSIIGKALYARRFTLPEALEAMRRTA